MLNYLTFSLAGFFFPFRKTVTDMNSLDPQKIKTLTRTSSSRCPCLYLCCFAIEIFIRKMRGMDWRIGGPKRRCDLQPRLASPRFVQEMWTRAQSKALERHLHSFWLRGQSFQTGQGSVSSVWKEKTLLCHRASNQITMCDFQSRRRPLSHYGQ